MTHSRLANWFFTMIVVLLGLTACEESSNAQVMPPSIKIPEITYSLDFNLHARIGPGMYDTGRATVKRTLPRTMLNDYQGTRFCRSLDLTPYLPDANFCQVNGDSVAFDVDTVSQQIRQIYCYHCEYESVTLRIHIDSLPYSIDQNGEMSVVWRYVHSGIEMTYYGGLGGHGQASDFDLISESGHSYFVIGDTSKLIVKETEHTHGRVGAAFDARERKLRISFAEVSESEMLNIVDVLGRTVVSRKISPGEKEIELSTAAMPLGLYVVQFGNASKSIMLW